MRPRVPDSAGVGSLITSLSTGIILGLGPLKPAAAAGRAAGRWAVAGGRVALPPGLTMRWNRSVCTWLGLDPTVLVPAKGGAAWQRAAWGCGCNTHVVLAKVLVAACPCVASGAVAAG